MRHLEKADPKGVSRSDLHKCAKIVMSKHFRSTKPSVDQRKTMCDLLVSRGLAMAAMPMAIRTRDPQGGQKNNDVRLTQQIEANVIGSNSRSVLEAKNHHNCHEHVEG